MAQKFELLEKAAVGSERKIEIPDKLPVIPTRTNMLVYPSSVMPLYVGREKSLAALEESIGKFNQMVFLVSQRDITKEEPEIEDLFEIGTIARIVQLMKMPDGNYKILVEGLTRARLSSVEEGESTFIVVAEKLKSKGRKSKMLQALVRRVKELALRYVSMSRRFPDEAIMALEDTSDADKFADFVSSMVPFSLEEKQRLLEEIEAKDRLNTLMELLTREIEILSLEEELDKRVKQKIEQGQKEYYLREKMRAIQEELEGEEDEEIKELKEMAESGELPQEVKEKAEQEISRLEKMSPYSPEATVVRTYLDWLLNLPWQKETDDEIVIKDVRKTLDNNHYGLDDVKERILEFLAARRFSKNLRTPILCLVGPPGVGKTSLGRSVSEAMGRKFGRISLGGMRDEAEIRGHRRTYVGALPGRIMQMIRKLKTRNPVIVLDEVDKMGISFQGDPASALLEVLDPEQNNSFTDHFLEVPFDLSRVLFITTANVLYSIPAALKDRMEIIEIPGYTESEKYHIAREHILPKLLDEYNMKAGRLKITPAATRDVIRDYTREAGVRELDRNLAKIIRKATLKIAEGADSISVGVNELGEYLGAPLFKESDFRKHPEVGVVTGLAWTSVGGEIMYIEVLPVSGKGKTIITGQLGDVMKESAQIAASLARKLCGDEKFNEIFEKKDFHIHVPEGAVPKDGPSAGITLTTAIVSAVTGRKVRNDIAMTGEITLRGKVLPIGGLKEKLMAAYRARMKKVLIPLANKRDLDKVPEEIKSKLEFVFVENISEVLEEALIQGDGEEC
ncbi:DNA-binding protein [Mesotoga sp. Brook.08.YT.4.2.5.1]|jgi:ATP-dependent Lon protease|uniref:endopeptidase La n=1 Tax=unclassified Mesotoga TaxID=1184398 RepID=UPI000C1756C1|nr:MULTISPECIES: endopeptidase La [unclassified Mesotoga]PNE22984.1 DNA-binding protein [Mesotoga sp. Brook.08.YT.4.2.5.1]PNS42088.1 DNA-binding protein [Mesotoga sp. B105.6.4]PVD15949.1 peptidase [Mesotoga sp. Brook.08.105.5.1]RAO97952.1 peptidase [Mesotoga sp. Brook.08.YT.4.2.5.4.]RDI93973.1 DNA-binding protein [Mesotoga sp. Brook.08.YT.4.2.5.2.]